MKTTLPKQLAFFCLLFIFSCKKTTDKDLTPLTDPSLIESITNEWYKEVKVTFSDDLLKITDSIVFNLDFSVTGHHELHDGTTLHLI